MDSLKAYYRLLLGLDKTWEVTNAELNVAAKSVTIALEYRGRGGVYPKCRVECGLKDHASERTAVIDTVSVCADAALSLIAVGRLLNHHTPQTRAKQTGTITNAASQLREAAFNCNSAGNSTVVGC